MHYRNAESNDKGVFQILKSMQNPGIIIKLFRLYRLHGVHHCRFNGLKAYRRQREAKSSNAEVDYVTQKGQQIVPVEVKSGTSGAMQSMHLFIEEKKSSFGVRFSMENYIACEKIKVYPLYAVSDFVRG